MTHSSKDFAAHFISLLKNIGPSGPTGPSKAKSLKNQEKVGTTESIALGPVDNDWSQHGASSGPSKRTEKQALSEGGTTGTGGTAISKGGEDGENIGASPAEWHAVLAELERCDCPDWISQHRWNCLLGDAARFLDVWGFVAYSLGWTALDLFGVHPFAPAARFDVMGLLFLVEGGEVVALTDECASLQRLTKARLTYRRHPTDDAVIVTSVLS